MHKAKSSFNILREVITPETDKAICINFYNIIQINIIYRNKDMIN